MEAKPNKDRWFDLSWFLFWAILSSIWCVSAASRLSATFDEPFYLKQGLESWRSGSYHALLRVGTMPLPIDLETLPLYIWERCRGVAIDPVADFDRLLPVARAANLVFWWLLLFYGWRLAKLFGGAWAGRFAVLFLACEPNFLAHAALATTDIAVTGCMIAFVYHFWLGRDRSWRYRIGIPAFWYGLAVLAKASAFVFGPLAMISLELYRKWNAGAFAVAEPIPAGQRQTIRRRLAIIWRATYEFRRDMQKIFFLGFVIVFAYCRTDFKPQKSFVQWAGNLPDNGPRAVMLPIAENLCIFPNAGEGLVYQIKHNIRGHGVYLMGEWDRRAFWYYFPVALVIKLTLPILLLTVGLLCCSWRRMVNPVAMIALVLLLFSLNCRVQIGIRLVLPMVAFLICALAIGIAKLLPERLPRWIPRAVTSAIACIMVIPPLSVWPNGLSYINTLWGGTDQGYKYLSDSNYDWGQGLKELDEWEHQHAVANLRIWYFGTDPRQKRDPAFVFLHSMPLATEDDVNAQLRGTYLAVATSILHNNPQLTPATQTMLEVLHRKEPIARTTTFFIYDFTEPRSLAQSQ